MKKLIAYVLVFVLGFAACAFVLRYLGYDIGAGSKSGVISNLTSPSSKPVVKKGDNPIADAAELVGPAVVNIDTFSERQVNVPFGPFFSMPETRLLQGAGSGVIISEDGYILTNNHVVAGAKKIVIYLKDGRKFNARIIGRDPLTEVAVIKVNAKGLPAAKLGNSDNIKVGDWAIAIGNPLRQMNSVTVGVISAIGRDEIVPQGRGVVLRDLIQTDAAINPGNSGGPLVNIHGEVVGINTMIATAGPGAAGSIGIGFAIPINDARKVSKQLIQSGKYPHPWLGVYMGDLTSDLAARYAQRGFKAEQGAVIMQVQPNSPAIKAGIFEWDIVTEVDGIRIKSAAELSDHINKAKVGQVIQLSVWRMGKSMPISVKLEEMPQEFR